jgi:Zn-dependent protease with chaperone function
MNPEHATIHGLYFDGRRPVGSAATLIFGGQEAALIGAAVAQRYRLRKLRVSPRVGRGDRFISLPDGGQLQCADQPALDRLHQEVPSEGLVAWLEQRWAVALACLVLTLGVLAAGYLYGLPAAAEAVARRIPVASERPLGEQAQAWLEQRGWLTPSHLPATRQAALREGFRKLHRGLPQDAHYRLEFRASRLIGENAFALPGGTILITDEMIRAARSDEEVLAVLAHEIGHVELRHTLRHLLADSVVGVVATTLTGDAASLSVAVAGLPVLLAQAKYSREFETEADDFAFALLKRHGLSPEAFAGLMERLAQNGDKAGEREMSFLSTHPVTAERVARARAAAR